MGVPVVRPSKTPERIRTVSGSRRCETKCELPGRRRSTSGCRSASLKGSPGGQPSTTQPSAAPWLSPKLVTVNKRPNELPDMRLFAPSVPLPAAPRPPRGAEQLLAAEQQHPAPAAGELQPRQRPVLVLAAHCVLRIADLDDQDAGRAQGSGGP